mmetsp:Transcript_98073/g.282924  ORF Transcript_98073/g.282924 Transcript_98073/m.282924 type:complete len:119 (-) Transcript_98073:146-502(-)|eukprot:CAMPEP_0176101088 /NCGR_PEP_ID=MMETSP0120_2-20121206/50703_1 /TAXON_ID=160619 /ORGANISM="Kryptoperidinium foliaceum, Strain CCMP 1326" /LENGTH=118 /DNA_ID=CAMNT_0017435139 /DNA_START=66 /DNA_END=422 /DNA_ORIENTATION=+
MASAWRRWALFAVFALVALLGSATAEDAVDADDGADPDLPEPNEEEEMQSIFEELDLDKNGKLDKEELLKSGGEEADEGFSASLSKHFPVADADGDGALDVKEMSALIDLFSQEEEEL